MDLTRLLVPLGIFAVVSAVALWQFRRDQRQGIDAAVSVERFNRQAVRHSSTIGLVVAVVIFFAGVAEANPFIAIGGIGLIAFQLWRRSIT